jgi:3-dehydroquinate synthase
LGEILKLAIINDYDLFQILEENASLLRDEKFQNEAISVKIINKSISIMIGNLQSNLWEENLERAVDFGHTFEPLIEQLNLPDLLHGEAVALDCLFSSCISLLRGLLPEADLSRVRSLVAALGLPVSHKDFLNFSILTEVLSDIKKHRDGNQNLPVPNRLGSCIFINDLTEKEISGAIEIFRNIDK